MFARCSPDAPGGYRELARDVGVRRGETAPTSRKLPGGSRFLLALWYTVA